MALGNSVGSGMSGILDCEGFGRFRVRGLRRVHSVGKRLGKVRRPHRCFMLFCKDFKARV